MFYLKYILLLVVQYYVSKGNWDALASAMCHPLNFSCCPSALVHLCSLINVGN